MSDKNPEYDFLWCPGCGDFGVRRGLELALEDYSSKHELPMYSNVVVAGIGCSGNLVHLLEGDQPYGFHGIHGRSLPVAMGVKMSSPELNVVVVAGDGDFLSIGMEHIAPQAARNLNITAVIMDNGVYGLTKGQASPTTTHEKVTSSTPWGKFEQPVHPLDLYLTLGVTYIASGYSSKPKDMATLIVRGMEHKGFSIVHVASPCTTYNDTYTQLKGSAKLGIKPTAWNIPADHDVTDKMAARQLVAEGGVPVGVLYEDNSRPAFDEGYELVRAQHKAKGAEELLAAFDL